MKPAPSWEHLLGQVQIEFVSAIFHRCGPAWRPVPRVMPDEQVHLVHAGVLEYTIGGASHRARSRQVVFCPPGIEWTTRRISPTPIDLTVIHFQATFPGGRRYLDAFGFPYVLTPHARALGTMSRLARRLCELYKARPPGHALKELALIHDFFHAFFDLRGSVAPVDRDGERVLKLIGFMRQNYRQRITLESLSRLVFVSANHLATIFREYTGRSPIDYLIHLRLEEARRLLQSRELPIGEITALVGYDDPAYFSRLFRKHVGMSPLQFRLNRRSLT